jgi:hypothetical protein
MAAYTATFDEGDDVCKSGKVTIALGVMLPSDLLLWLFLCKFLRFMQIDVY